MALGVLEDHSLEHVPGTVYVYDNLTGQEASVHDHARLKKDPSGQIILVPQPSDDPNDPLNWPVWKRDMILGILSLVSVVAATTSPLLAADSVSLAIYFKHSFTDVALLTGYHLCGVGVGGFIFVASARVWGKRHLFLLGIVLMIISSAWGGASHYKTGYTSLLWARVLQGIALAPFEALVNACVGDLYFVHERGTRMALTNVALFGGAFLTPVIVGKMSFEIGWQWTFYLIAILMGIALPVVFFFVPETAYRRADYLNTDIDDTAMEMRNMQKTSAEVHSSDGSVRESQEKTITTRALPATATAPHSLKQRIKIFNGRKTDESFLKLLFRPIPLFFHPAILWACLIQGVIIGWTVMIGVTIAAVYIGPPQFFTEVQTGYLYTGAFIGSLVGLFLSGFFSDLFNKVMIRANKGKYEPEFRILLVFPMLIFCAIGLYGFGATTAHTSKWGWLVPDVFLGFVIVGMVMGAVASALYIVDAYRDLAVEAFTCLLIFKNMFSFILTYFAYDWIFKGRLKIFMIIASIQVVICLLSVPMYIFGKRNRSYFHRHDLLKLTHLR